MKLTREETYKPITIVVENQEELDQLIATCYSSELQSIFPFFKDIRNTLFSLGIFENGKSNDYLASLEYILDN